MKENKVVHFNLFRPENSLFKQKMNSKAEIQIIACSNSDNCQLLQLGSCACQFGLCGGSCHYGKKSVQTGPTRRAKGYRLWCTNQKRKYDGVPFLNTPKRLGVVGNYVFLPYPHMNLLKTLQWDGQFIEKECFTCDNIIKLVKYQPIGMFDRIISSYQKEIPPLFLKHLSEQMPDLFQQVVASDKNAKMRFEEFTNIGREAILETTTPNVEEFEDIHGGLWMWDGAELHSCNSKMSFGLCKFSRVSITPVEKQKVKITNENQVNEDTVFID